MCKNISAVYFSRIQYKKYYDFLKETIAYHVLSSSSLDILESYHLFALNANGMAVTSNIMFVFMYEIMKIQLSKFIVIVSF